MVILALSGADEAGTLQWFLQELQQDIEVLQEQGEPEHLKTEKTPVPEEDKEIVEECIQTLQSHPLCFRVSYLPSRKSFKVFSKDKRSSEFRVLGPKRKRNSTGDKQEVHNQFHKAVSAAKEFLDPSDSAPPIADAQEDPQEQPSA